MQRIMSEDKPSSLSQSITEETVVSSQKVNIYGASSVRSLTRLRYAGVNELQQSGNAKR